jgi:uncharacterized protein YfeS
LYEEHHSIFLPSLPQVKFMRRRRRVDIKYETGIADASFLTRYGFLSVEVFVAALREIADALHLMDGKLEKEDFDLERFHEDVATLITQVPDSEAGLRALKEKVEQEAKRRRAAMDPWELLDIDWDEFHPDARRLLDQPFFWSSTDGYAPHGNDTGADLLSDFTKWHRRHPDVPAHEMAAALLRAWDIAPMEFGAVDEEDVRRVLATDPIALSVTDDALVAVAFASIKLRGRCDAQTRGYALAALARQRTPAVLTDRGWEDPAERLRTLDLMLNALEKAPEVTTEGKVE